MRRATLRLVLLGMLAAGCASESETPSDDPADYDVAPGSYLPRLSGLRWVVPAEGLAARARPMASNNNVEIIFHDGLLYMAWRTGPTHFASAATKMLVVSSTDQGRTWAFEHEIAIQRDVREPRFVSVRGRLFLYYVELGRLPTEFTPRGIWRIERRGLGDWTEPVRFAEKAEVVWRIKQRSGWSWMTTYRGLHYGPSKGELDVYFRRSDDGLTYEPVQGNGVVYHGGVSEVAFEFDSDGGLWAVTRNEDGDDSGFGAHVCHAKPRSLGTWECSKSDPYRYDSPAMFRHAGEIYLVARRDPNGPFDLGHTDLPFEEQKARNLAAYSLSTKRTALYRIDRPTRTVVHLLDLPSAGDNAFPSVRRLSAHEFLIANYTSPLDKKDFTWIDGQIAKEGTQLYFITLTFDPR